MQEPAGPAGGAGIALGLLASGSIVTQSWVKSAPLREGEALFRSMLAAKGGDIKAVLLPWESSDP